MPTTAVSEPLTAGRDARSGRGAYQLLPEEQWLIDELSKTERGREEYTDFLIATLRRQEQSDAKTSPVPLALLTMSVFSCIAATAFMHQAVRLRKWALGDQEGDDSWSDQRTLRVGWISAVLTISIWGGLHVSSNPSAYGDFRRRDIDGHEVFEATVSAVLSDAGFLATGLLLAGTIPSVFAIYNFAVGLLVLRGRPGENAQGSFLAGLVALPVTTIGFVSSVVTIYAFIREG